MEKGSFKPNNWVKTIEEETPEELETTLKMEWQQLPKEEEAYKIIDEQVQAGAYVEAKSLTSALMKAYIKEGKSLSPQLEAYILSDWYKQTHIEEIAEVKQKTEQVAPVSSNREDKEEVKVYQNVPAIVVGRNQAKRIINVAWGREQEGFFKWNFRTPLPNYNDTLSLSFEQKVTRGIMNVKQAQALEGETGFLDDFYRIDEISLEANESNEFIYQGKALPSYLFGKQNIASLQAGDKALVHWIYKFQPKDREFSWSIIRVEVPAKQLPNSEEGSKNPLEEQESQEQVKVNDTPQKAIIQEDRLVQENTQTGEQEKKVFEETHTLIINDIPLRNGELTCRCLTNNNELIYFRKSLTQMEVNRLDKLIISGLVRYENFGKQFIKITQIRLAEDKDFPETILRKRVRRLHKEENNIFLDDEQLAARKVQLLKIKHLMLQEKSEDLSVLVEEMYLYAVHIKDYEWTIAKISAVKTNEAEEEVSPIAPKDEELSPAEKKKQEEALRQPWQVRVGYITKVDEEQQRVEIVYGIRKKGYIAIEDFPLTSPYEGDWLGMKMLDGKEPMHEIVFHDVIRLDPNKRLPNTSKLIYKVRRGVLWFSEQDHCFKLHNAPISQELVLEMNEPKYKDYYLVEELLDYNEKLGDFAWRPIKVEKFEYLEPASEMEGHIYPQKFRQEEAFLKALANLEAIAPKIRKDKNISEESTDKAETKVQKQAEVQSCNKEPKQKETQAIKTKEQSQNALILEGLTVSFCPQKASKHRRKAQGKSRGIKGLRAKKNQG